MGFDPTRANPVYTPPQQAKNYGKPQSGPSYVAPGLGSNTGGFTGKMYTMSPLSPKTAGPAPGMGKGGMGKAGQAGMAPDPGKGSAYATKPAAAPAASPYGSESGPGILESWFNQRATGTDPAFEYAMKRGTESLGNRYAAAGSYNSGAAAQGQSDMAANLIAQREGQLDALAGGASGEHAGRLAQMFGTGNAIASGESGINSAYDIAAANAQSNAINAALGYGINKAGVDSQSNKQGLSNLISLGGLFA